ncbi:MAG TPA: tRNA pseudouridine(55) synthase TruB [Spirochaetota bacterium]|nr:tRNA pseudouridine(55) synthase TruB [Spirochaetota bacterium]
MDNSVLLIDKREGLTSFETIREVRRLLGVRKIGHAGTLDKYAAGLLVVLTGRATRLSAYLLGSEKTYRATVKLGVVTDTGDREGKIISTSPAEGVSEDDILGALSSFMGETLQVPPVYSALKIGGKRASDLARQGKDVSLKERKIVISELSLVSFEAEFLRFTIDVRCSKGTYIRSLARDIGDVLGTGAYMEGLRRTASGPFSVDDAVTIEELGSFIHGNPVAKDFRRRPVEGFPGFSICVVGDSARARILNGAVFAREEALSVAIKEEKKFIILDSGQNLIAIADIDIDKWHINYDCVVNL